MRKPEHTTIQIVVEEVAADRIEHLFAPFFTLMMMPAEMQSENDLPIYFLGLTKLGAAKFMESKKDVN